MGQSQIISLLNKNALRVFNESDEFNWRFIPRNGFQILRYMKGLMM